MTNEDKQLLLADLCARLPYGVKIHRVLYGATILNERSIESFRKGYDDALIPYLRPLSSMTEEEREELEHLSDEYFGKALDKQIQESLASLDGNENRNESRILEYIASSVIVDWLNAHHLDYRGLIEKGLAISTEVFNPYE